MDMLLSEFSSTHSIEALCSLLNNPIDEEQIDCNDSFSSSGLSGPGDIGPTNNLHPAAINTQKNSKEIWDKAEVTEEINDIFDQRVQPEYEIIFKQRVDSTDVFLGFSRKNPSTACCEDMLNSAARYQSLRCATTSEEYVS
ncbi:Hypothetical predicted protein [Pelobates cultripes]|uniref:Uncharacterized protein n=1 Tax=Pelobates cultripes TaxID=61616 RepID=A0AAD1T5Y6_PELCU|nr:Hypothetical predicted protein [Pelobates cultripes]